MIGRIWPALDNFRARDEVERREDIPYGQLHSKQALDLFLPKKRSGPVPWVLFAHGGGWRRQDRKLLRPLSGLYSNVGMALAERGVAVAVASYRQPFGVHSLEDLRRAIWWIHAQGPSRIVAMGHSLGGLYAAVLGQDSHVHSVVSLGGAYDLQRLRAALPPASQKGLDTVFEPSLHPFYSPERQLNPKSSPHMLVIAEHDPAELQQEHRAMLTACRERGVSATELQVPGVGHMGLILEVGRRVDRVSGPIAEFVLRP